MLLTWETSPLMQSMARAFVAIERRTANGNPPSHGFPSAVGLAMSACESGCRASVTGANNYFGIMRPPSFPGDTQSAWCETTEYTTPSGLTRFRDDERATAVLINTAKGEYSMYRWFAAYPSLEAAVAAYVNLLTDSTHYHPSWLAYQKDGDADKFLQATCATGYTTGPAFKVGIEIAPQQSILHAVDMARTEG
jgi:hypothetical protein